MRDDQQRAGEVEQGVFEHFLRRDVQMVRGFVEDQEIGAGHHEFQERQFCFLTPGQILYLLEDVVPVKAEPAQQLAQLDLVVFDVGGMHLFEHGLLRVQQFLLLVVVAAHDVLAQAQPAAVGLQLPEDDLQQRRLAHAVRADHADAVAFLDVHVDPGEQLFSALRAFERHGEVFRQQHVLPALQFLVEADLQFFAEQGGLVWHVQHGQAFFAGLRPLDEVFRIVLFETPDDLLLARDLRAELFVML